MAPTTQVYRSRIASPASHVLAWHARPGAFERLNPPWIDVRVLDTSGGIAPGDGKRLRIAAGPVGLTWQLVHRAGDDEFGFVDDQVEGPFRSWSHEHRFLLDGTAASLLEDRITYELPFVGVGSLLAGGNIHNRLDDLFRFRHRRTQHDLARHAGLGSDQPLKVAVTGASGLVGRQLVPFLRAGGHTVTSLVRGRPNGSEELFWDPAAGEIDATGLEGMDAVVHLAGESIADRRWTATRKQAILASRVQGTGLLARTLSGLQRPPRVLVSASAVGYYGDAGNTDLPEDAPAGEGFLAEVCKAWEDAAAPAANAGIRVVHPRFGVVLSGDGGLLARVGRPFRFGLGGPLGSGEQIMSWIAIDDLLGVILTAIADDRLSGPVNSVSPRPVTNASFTAALGRVLGRPAFVRAPAPVLRLVAGQLADELLLASQLARPARLADIGFHFEFPTIEDALRHEFGRFNGQPTPTTAEPLAQSLAQAGRGQ